MNKKEYREEMLNKFAKKSKVITKQKMKPDFIGVKNRKTNFNIRRHP